MKIEPLQSGRLKIWMTGEDMRLWGLRFEDMNDNDRTTRIAVMKLLHVVRQRTDLPVAGTMMVEAIPVEDGCMLLLTPEHRRPLFHMPQAQIYAFHNVDDVLQFGEALKGAALPELPTASLYEWDSEYRLILYPGLCPLRDSRFLLSEFAQQVGEGTAAAAFVEEHGTPVTVGDALHKLVLGSA